MPINAKAISVLFRVLFRERNNVARYFRRVEETHTFADGLLIEKEYTLLR